LAHSLSKRVSGTTPYYNLIRRVAFPSTRAIVVTSFLLATVGVGLSFLVAEQTTSSFLFGAIWGIMIFIAPYFLSDIALHSTIMKEDPLFYFRRCLALSLFTMTTWIIIFLVSSGLALAVPQFIFPDFAIIIGLFSVFPLRAVAVFSMSKTNFATRTIFTLSEPTLTVLVAILLFRLAPGRMLFTLVLSALVGLAFAFGMITAVEVYGRRTVGFSPNRMFRAFLADWLEGRNSELESYLSEIGIETEIDVSAFTFRHKESKRVKSVVLVSNFHPGPFTNVGSSVLPFLFQRVIEERFGAIALVPHGVSGHELNLVSQEQNARVISWVLSNFEGATYYDEATPVIRVNNGIATATSQVFDGRALVTMTTSPQDMEDVPYAVGKQIASTALRYFRGVALVDAHNCLTGPTTMSAEKIRALEEVASASMEDSAKRQGHAFKVGVARKIPAGFTLRDGIGPGGVALLAVEVNGQRFAYVTIDGNNMIKGLREEILGKVKHSGFDDAEVMTTDTHMVNGIVHAPLGYHVVGEVIPWNSLLADVAAACQEAIASLEASEVGVISGQVVVTTLGSKSLRQVMRLVYRISKLTAVTLFPMVVIVTVLSLLFLV
jgi:putative membrane protein